MVSTPLKNIINWIISPSRGENKKYLKPPPRYQHLDISSYINSCHINLLCEACIQVATKDLVHLQSTTTTKKNSNNNNNNIQSCCPSVILSKTLVLFRIRLAKKVTSDLVEFGWQMWRKTNSETILRGEHRKTLFNYG